MTNFEKIKNMSVEELAEKLDELSDCDCCSIKEFCDKKTFTRCMSCTDVWKDWLKSEVTK